jgi:Beta/Gamma crystallin
VKGDDCYIDIWREANFEGESLRLHGPAEFAHLGFEQGDWSDQIGSLRIGPRAFVLAYRDRDFKDKHVTFGPNDEVSDLGEWKFDDDIESVRVIDSLKIFDRLLERDSFAAAGDEKPPREPKRGKAKVKRR